MRPASIRIFEALSLVAVAIGVLIIWMSWESVLAYVRAELPGAGLEAGLAVLSFIYVGLLILFILLTAHRASAIAKWLYVIVTVGTLVTTLPNLGAMAAGGGAGWLTIVQLVLQFAGAAMLFTRPSRDWFAQWRKPVRLA